MQILKKVALNSKGDVCHDIKNHILFLRDPKILLLIDKKTPVRYYYFAEHWTGVLRGKYEYVWNLIAICWSIWETEVVVESIKSKMQFKLTQ